MRTRFRVSVGQLILLIAGVSLGLSMIRWNDSAVRYRTTGDTDAFYSTLKNQLKNGDEVDKVMSLSGIGSEITDLKMHAYYTSFAQRNPSENPQGGQDTDRFIAYKAGAWNIVLQIRNRRLINFNPTDYPLKTGDILTR